MLNGFHLCDSFGWTSWWRKEAFCSGKLLTRQRRDGEKSRDCRWNHTGQDRETLESCWQMVCLKRLRNICKERREERGWAKERAKGMFFGTEGEGTELAVTQKMSKLTATNRQVRTHLWGQAGKGTALSKCSYFYFIVPSHTELSQFKQCSNSDSTKSWLLV